MVRSIAGWWVVKKPYANLAENGSSKAAKKAFFGQMLQSHIYPTKARYG
jgi:hypothetical protein